MLGEGLLPRHAYQGATDGQPRLLFVDAQPLDKHRNLGLLPYGMVLEYTTDINPITVVNLPRGDQLPTDPGQFDGIFFGGSRHDVHMMLPWMKEEKEFMEAATGKVPILASCFGHQLYASLQGGKIHELPEKLVGYKSITKTDEGMKHPSLIGLPDSFVFAASHLYFIGQKPPVRRGVIPIELASGILPNEILVYQDSDGKQLAITSQLHPEFSQDIIPAFARDARRTPALYGNPNLHNGNLVQHYEQTNGAGRIFVRNWVEQQVYPRHKARLLVASR